MKKTYIAIFKDVTVNRKSEKEYKFAWCVTYDFDNSVKLCKLDAGASYIEKYKNCNVTHTGFSMTRENAEKAANKDQSHYFMKKINKEIIAVKVI